MLFLSRFLRRIARLLTLVMLLTVFSPSFGWEAVDGAAPHEHVGIVLSDSGMADSMNCHDRHAVLNDAHDQQHSTAQADLEHHCCPGHVLGHLFGGIGAATFPLLMPKDTLAVDRSNQAFSTHFPEGLERPPRPAA